MQADPGLKAPGFQVLITEKDSSAFNLNLVYLSLRHYTKAAAMAKAQAQRDKVPVQARPEVVAAGADQRAADDADAGRRRCKLDPSLKAPSFKTSIAKRIVLPTALST